MQRGKQLAFEAKHCLHLQGRRKNLRKILRNCGNVPARERQLIISDNNKLHRHLHENLKSDTQLYVISMDEQGLNVTIGVERSLPLYRMSQKKLYNFESI
jgi:hypothetical protein